MDPKCDCQGKCARYDCFPHFSHAWVLDSIFNGSHSPPPVSELLLVVDSDSVESSVEVVLMSSEPVVDDDVLVELESLESVVAMLVFEELDPLVEVDDVDVAAGKLLEFAVDPSVPSPNTR